MSAGSERGRKGGAASAALSAAELLCSYDLRGNLIEINEALRREIGYSPDELLACALRDLLETESWEAMRQNTLEQVGGAHTEPLEIRIRSKAGRVIPVGIFTRLVFEKGTPVALQAFGRNLSGALPEALLVAEERLSSTKSQLALFTQHLKQLHRLGTTNYESLNQVFADYLKTGCEIFQLSNGMVLQVEGTEAVVRAIHGGSTGLHAGTRLELAETYLTTVTERLRTITRSDGEPKAKLRPEFRVCIGTPILVDTELFGTLSFSSCHGRPARTFSREEKEIVELMASSIARFVLETQIQAERRSAEGLERQRNHVLEMVAENRPLKQTLADLVGLVEDQCPKALACVLVFKDGVLSLRSAPSLPASFEQAVRDRQLRLSADQTLQGHAKDLISRERFGFAAEFGLEVSCIGPIYSGTGLLLGAIVVFRPDSETVGGREEDIVGVAARLAGIAIEQRQLTDRLAFQAQHDFLTGLPNRFRLLELLEQRLREAQPGMISVLFVDLDRFKQINDTLGHSIGDRLLIEVAERLRSGLSSADEVAARMGGDEFAVILLSPRDEEAAVRTSRTFLEALRSPYLIDGRELFVTASIGVSFFPKHGDSASILLRKADAAMYRAKKEGKNAVECAVLEGHQGAIEKLDLENALRRALEKSEFELFFQPIVSMQGELDGLEVLLAWNHATRGKISPNQFIPMAEETGLIVPIGAWVLRAACERGAGWLLAGLPLKRIAVNVSALQFAKPDFVDTIAAALASTGFPPALLELELTESLVLRDIGESIHRMTQLQNLGVTMAIDDFGTGYSSLNYLRRLPVDELKIDQSFLRDMRSASGTLTVVQTIVTLAHQMNLSVIAEGVETIEELELLRAAGCDRIQGHLYGGSLRAHEVEQLLARPDRRVPMKPPPKALF